MSDWQHDKRWSDRFIPEIRGIVARHLILEAPLERTKQYNTDLIVLRSSPCASRVACVARNTPNATATSSPFARAASTAPRPSWPRCWRVGATRCSTASRVTRASRAGCSATWTSSATGTRPSCSAYRRLSARARADEWGCQLAVHGVQAGLVAARVHHRLFGGMSGCGGGGPAPREGGPSGSHGFRTTRHAGPYRGSAAGDAGDRPGRARAARAGSARVRAATRWRHPRSDSQSRGRHCGCSGASVCTWMPSIRRFPGAGGDPG